MNIPPSLPLLDLTARVDDPAVVGVWSLAVYRPDERKIAERVALYRPPNTRRMYGFEHGGVVLACIGVQRYPQEDRITIHQVGTAADYQRRGLGRRLLDAVCDQLKPRVIECGTDETAVGFYRKCGFAIESLGIAPTGVECFRCRLTCDKTHR